MKKTIFSLMLATFSFGLMAKETTIELINEHISKLHNGAEVMTVLNGGADFIGFDLGAARTKYLLNTLMNAGSLEDFALEVGGDIGFKKDKHFSERKVKRIVSRLKKSCEKYLKSFNQNNEYACSEIFVYSGDVSDPQIEGRYHKARGQKDFEFMEEQAGTLSPSITRRSLPSNNEKYANYDVYLIGIIKI